MSVGHLKFNTSKGKLLFTTTSCPPLQNKHKTSKTKNLALLQSWNSLLTHFLFLNNNQHDLDNTWLGHVILPPRTLHWLPIICIRTSRVLPTDGKTLPGQVPPCCPSDIISCYLLSCPLHSGLIGWAPCFPSNILGLLAPHCPCLCLKRRCHCGSLSPPSGLSSPVIISGRPSVN